MDNEAKRRNSGRRRIRRSAASETGVRRMPRAAPTGQETEKGRALQWTSGAERRKLKWWTTATEKTDGGRDGKKHRERERQRERGRSARSNEIE